MKHHTLKYSGPSLILVSIIVLFSLLIAISAYAAPGDLDTDFNTPNGYSTLDLGYPDGAYAVAIQEDGKIVAVGDEYDGKSPARAPKLILTWYSHTPMMSLPTPTASPKPTWWLSKTPAAKPG